MMAFEDGGSPSADPKRAGVIVGTGIGGMITYEQQVMVLHEKGANRVSPFLVTMIMPNAAPAITSMHLGFQGPCETVATACASGTHAISHAANLIAEGRCEIAIGAGTEAAITPVAVAAFANMTALSVTGISRPFDAMRDGFVIAEGAAALLLEDFQHATARKAHIYCEIIGTASTADAHHITAPAPGGVGATECMRLAISDAGLKPSDIVHINAHGTSTPLNDAAESQAIHKVFGDTPPPVTSIKGITGHSMGAAGAIEAVAVSLSLQNRQIPPTAGFETADPEIELDIVNGSPRKFEPGPVLSNSFGFGGHNGCVVFAPTRS
jgi:3-oxoacyl-[acyl-carrier-protein] synthase II